MFQVNDRVVVSNGPIALHGNVIEILPLLAGVRTQQGYNVRLDGSRDGELPYEAREDQLSPESFTNVRRVFVANKDYVLIEADLPNNELKNPGQPMYMDAQQPNGPESEQRRVEPLKAFTSQMAAMFRTNKALYTPPTITINGVELTPVQSTCLRDNLRDQFTPEDEDGPLGEILKLMLPQPKSVENRARELLDMGHGMPTRLLNFMSFMRSQYGDSIELRLNAAATYAQITENLGPDADGMSPSKASRDWFAANP